MRLRPHRFFLNPTWDVQDLQLSTLLAIHRFALTLRLLFGEDGSDRFDGIEKPFRRPNIKDPTSNKMKMRTAFCMSLCALLIAPVTVAQHSPGDILFKRSDGQNGGDFTGDLPDNVDQELPIGELDDPTSSIITQINVDTEAGAPAAGIDLLGDNFDLGFVFQFYDADGVFSFTENFDDKVQVTITPVTGPNDLTATGDTQQHSDLAWNVRTYGNFDFGGGGWFNADVLMSEDGGGAQSAAGIGFGYANSNTQIEGDFGLVGNGATFDQDAVRDFRRTVGK